MGAVVFPAVNPALLDLRVYGVIPDGVTLNNLSTTNGSTTVSSSTYTFGPGDVGKYVSIAGAGATIS